MNVNFDWTIHFGDVMVVLAALSTAAAYLFRGGGKFKQLQLAIDSALAEISDLKSEISQINKILTQLAVQEERLTMLTKWYDELRRGVGRIGRGETG